MRKNGCTGQGYVSVEPLPVPQHRELGAAHRHKRDTVSADSGGFGTHDMRQPDHAPGRAAILTTDSYWIGHTLVSLAILSGMILLVVTARKKGGPGS